MMGENPNYWWSLNGKLQPPPSQQAYAPAATFLSTPPLPLPLPLPVALQPTSSILNPPYLFGSSLLVPAANPNSLPDHQHHENQDFPVSWSQLLMNGLANDQEHHNLIRSAAHAVGEVKYGYLDINNQQSRQLYYSNKNDHHGNNNITDQEDLQAACSSSNWSSQLPSVGSSSTMSLSTTTMFDFSSKIDSQNQHANQYSSQYDDTSTSSVSKKPRFQSSNSTRPNSSMECNDTFTSGTSKRARPQHSSTQTPLKVRKEKLGDRISALHQLVSPFGKTDTASVLLEATAQIRFLEGQIEALSSPYMNLANNVSGGTRHQHAAPDGKALPKDLASRGLCLVPVACMDHIDTTNMTSNGAEFWTPALGGGF